MNVKKIFIEKVFGRMMLCGVDKMGLFKMNFVGMGLKMIKGIMKKYNIMFLLDLIDLVKE